MSPTLDRLAPVADARPAAAVVEARRLGAAAAPPNGRPRVAAAMIASADGRAAVAGTSAGPGHPADSALLRELRTAVDAILVGTGTLRAAPGAPLDALGRLVLRDVHRAGEHLSIHCAAAS